MQPQPLICVTDVEASSRWYQRLLNCGGAHGGKQYEQLVKDGRLILQLHSFEVEHHHGPIGNPADRPYGNGVLLWFEVDDFDAVIERAAEMGVEIVLPRHRNPPDDDNGGHHTRWMVEAYPLMFDGGISGYGYNSQLTQWGSVARVVSNYDVIAPRIDDIIA